MIVRRKLTAHSKRIFLRKHTSLQQSICYNFYKGVQMDFDEYQSKIKKYDFFEATDDLTSAGFSEKILGLVGEAGEAADKVKKVIRDHDGKLSTHDREALLKELGDTLWYLASIARYLGEPLSKVAAGNVEKLESRYQRNKLHGEGDER